ncbi:unnamed protein product [Rhodiola kirilowii]
MTIPCSSENADDPYINESNCSNNKRKRRPAGTPDPDAEVVSLSPKTLLESDRYVCEICNQGFQRDQNLQMHRRRHKVPWKLLKRENPVVRKRVFVCPEPSCLHHDPCHALGDLVGIKKHFRRKHSNHKQWVCHKCSKAYAVQSDYKAHLKTCGTRGHSCDCGRVFSRVESFIEHQDTCNMRRLQPAADRQQNSTTLVHPHAACMSKTAASPSRSSETTAPWPAALISMRTFIPMGHQSPTMHQHNLDLQLSTSNNPTRFSPTVNLNSSTKLQLSIGSSTDLSDKSTEANLESTGRPRRRHQSISVRVTEVTSVMEEEEEEEEMRLAVAERKQAKRQIDMAEQEFAYARQIRKQAQSELEKALILRDNAMKQISSTLLEFTCHSCKHQFQLE